MPRVSLHTQAPPIGGLFSVSQQPVDFEFEDAAVEVADSLGWGEDWVSEVVRAERIDYAEGEMDLVACPLADAMVRRL